MQRLSARNGGSVGAVAGALAVILALAGCGSTGSTPSGESPSSSDLPSAPATSQGASGSGSAPASGASAGSGSATAEAWTRGTTTTYTNSTGSAVQIGAQGGTGKDAPKVPQSSLAAGQSLSVNDPAGSTGSSVFARITYPDGKVAEFRVVNPVVDTPYVEWREGLIDLSWSSFPGEEQALDENESATETIAGHPITFTRLADDSDNKNWTVTLDG